MGSAWLFSLLVSGVLIAYPFSRVLPRVGLNPYYALAALIPIGAIVLLWVVAFRDWKES